MTSETITIIYTGESVENGKMDVRAVAPALLALGDVYQQSQKLIYPNERPLRLEIKAFEKGSFGIDLETVQSALKSAQSMFSNESSNAIANLITFISAGTGVFFAIKQLYKKEITEVKNINEGTVRVIHR